LLARVADVVLRAGIVQVLQEAGRRRLAGSTTTFRLGSATSSDFLLEPAPHARLRW
jgi:hypothetical protein